MNQSELVPEEDTKFTKKQNHRLIRKVIEHAEIESSSDLICTLAAIGKQTQNFLKSITDPILTFEYTNWRDDWSGNVNHVYKHLEKLDNASLSLVHQAYEDLLAYYLNDDIMNSIYPMDKKDHLGWKIYKEIDEKRLLCIKQKKLRAISGFNHV